MDGKVLGVEAYAMKNPQNTSDSRNPLKRGYLVFITKIDLSELCQKKTGFLVLLNI